MRTSSQHFLSIALALLCLAEPAMAQRRGGGFRGGGMSRGGARTSVSRPMGGGFNRGAVNRSNVRVNRPIRVADVDVNRNYYGRDYGCCYRPVARAATAAAVTAAAVGSVNYALPSSCELVVVNGETFQRCGNTYYEPQFSGTTTTYRGVSPP